MKEHLADIKHARDTPVAKHFNQTDHINARFASLIIEAINPDVENPTTTSLRRSQETYWIHQLRTLKPLGLNDHALRWPPPPFPLCSLSYHNVLNKLFLYHHKVQ